MPDHFPKSDPSIPFYHRFWLLQWVGWVGTGVASFPLKIYFLGSWQSALIATLVRESLGFVLTVGLRSIYRRYFDGALPCRSTREVACILFGASSLAALVDIGCIIGVDHLMGLSVMREPWLQIGTVCYRFFIFCVWSLLYFGIKEMQQSQMRALAVRDAELKMLRAQIYPHFFFNALNTIQAGIGKDPQALTDLVQSLAGYLRYTLKFRSASLVPLGEEYEAALNYFAVEKARFRDGIEIESCLEPSAHGVLVPGVIFQPLMENAVKHGLRTSPRPLRIRVHVHCPEPDWLEIVVANTGRWEPAPARGSDPASGVGLENLRHRLGLIYPGFDPVTTSERDGWVTVSLRIPVVGASRERSIH